MNIKEFLLLSATEKVPVDEYLRMRIQEDLWPNEFESVLRGAESIKINLQEDLDPDVKLNIQLAREIVRVLPLESYLILRSTSLERAAKKNRGIQNHLETSLVKNDKRQDEVFFREKRLRKDLAMTQVVVKASQTST